MKRVILAGVALLALAPSTVLAIGCNERHEQQAMSCAEGSIYDTDAQACVPVASS